jgi:hypothetical protein
VKHNGFSAKNKRDTGEEKTEKEVKKTEEKLSPAFSNR